MSTVKSAVLGFPRIGPFREIKKAVEAYWGDKTSADELLKVAKQIRLQNYETIKKAGVDVIPSGDFTLYDHVLDMSVLLGAIPKKYSDAKLSTLDLTFAMGRGRQRDGVDLEACEMKKWFDSNYHYIVPELSNSVSFGLPSSDADIKPLAQYLEAKEAGFETRPVILGPISYLVLGKAARDADASFKPISLLDKLLPVYTELLSKLKSAGVKQIQIDEPVLVLDAAAELGSQYKKAYAELSKAASGVEVTLATYFGRLESNLDYAKELPVQYLHVDLDRGSEQTESTISALKGGKLGLSLGLVSGRNIWKNDFKASLAIAKKAIDALGAERVVVATSSSLLHTPVTLANEKKLTEQQRDWFSFATEKVHEVATLAKSLSGADVKAALDANERSIKARRDFEKQSDNSVRNRLSEVKESDYQRRNPFAQRFAEQQKTHPLPRFPTTTIGSFPQTKEIRTARAKFTKGEINAEQYDEFIGKEIENVVKFQEKVGLDILVHGEPERNDMVQYFGERLTGFVFTENAWVQSYGSRYVRPPIVVSDISRPEPMTVRWSKYAQTLSKQPVKGMLTGPVTILAWSFPRADVPKEVQSRQLALALRDEVIDLEKAGIFAIQVDEPAIRELMPLRRSDWDAYLKWAVDSFRLSTAGVKDSTQTHSHFCYSDFNDIFSHIARLDADVISIEASKSDLKLLNVFEKHDYQNEIGPGLYDIHSPRVPSQQEIQERIASMLKTIPPERLFINPDCGLKTRGWPETEASLTNLVNAAKWARGEYKA